jgi:aminopeptidase YwaD
MLAMLASPAGATGSAGIDAAALRAHMEFLASDAMNGRGSGTRDEWITATYIAAQLRRLGLEPLSPDGGFVEDVEIHRTEAVGKPELHLGSLALVHGEQMLVSRLPAGSVQGPLQRYRPDRPVEAGATLLMPEKLDDGARPDVTAAALVLWHETPPLRAHWQSLALRAIVIGRPTLAGVAMPAASRGPRPAEVQLSADAYAGAAKLAEGSMVSLNATTHDVVAHTWNAAGMLRGHDRDRQQQVILLTAHLDHLGARDSGADRIYNGADDDASGSTAVLTLAEALAKGAPLKRSIVFAWFGSEEAGGYGAEYFVDKPVLPLARIVANLEFEMIGRPDATVPAHTLWLTGWERSNLGPELAHHGAHLVADPHPAENFFMRSDNITLARRGVVAQTVSSFGLHADYHQPSDDLSRIDFAHMTESVRSLLDPVRWLADSSFDPTWTAGGRPE